MDIEQAMNIHPDSALVESVESLKAALGSQTTLIYVLIAIAALSLFIAIAAMRRGRGEYSKAPAAAAAYPAPAATASVSNAETAWKIDTRGRAREPHVDHSWPAGWIDCRRGAA